jgi:DNA-binding NarL/FixJ family response regulator
VVALARAARPEEMIAVLERGAFGYLADGIGPDELVRALRSAAAGEPAIARSLVPYLIAHVRDRPSLRVMLPAGVVSLTPRESEVAELVLRGLSTADMAARLGISPVTVRRHVSSLSQKTGSPTRASLVDALQTLTING